MGCSDKKQSNRGMHMSLLAWRPRNLERSNRWACHLFGKWITIKSQKIRTSKLSNQN